MQPVFKDNKLVAHWIICSKCKTKWYIDLDFNRIKNYEKTH